MFRKCAGMAMEVYEKFQKVSEVSMCHKHKSNKNIKGESSMTLKKMLSLSMATVMASSVLLAGCGAKEPAQATPDAPKVETPKAKADEPAAPVESVEISIAHFSDPFETETVAKQIDLFMQQNPNIKVVAEPITGDFWEVLKTRMASNNEPDVFYMDVFQAGSFMDADRLLALDEHLTDYDMDDFYGSLVDAFKGTDGKIYGIPKDFNTLLLYYNKKMLADAGVEVPKTWDDLTAAATKLSTGGKKGLVLQNELPRFQPFFFSNGGSMMKDGKPVVNSPENAEALAYWVSLLKDGKIGDTPANLGVGWDGDAFGQEMVAMTVEGGWMVPYLRETAPDLDFGVAQIPMKKNPASMVFTVAYAVSANTKQVEASTKLAKFLSNKEMQQIVVDAGRAMPSRKSMGEIFSQKYPDRAEFFVAVPHASAFNYGVISPAVVKEVNDAAVGLLQGGATDAQKALDQAQANIDAALAAQ